MTHVPGPGSSAEVFVQAIAEYSNAWRGAHPRTQQRVLELVRERIGRFCPVCERATLAFLVELARHDMPGGGHTGVTIEGTAIDVPPTLPKPE